MQAESYWDCVCRKGVVRALDVINDWIVYLKWDRPLRKEQDLRKRLELELWLEISGARLGGMASSGSLITFKKNYYEKISTEKEKADVRQTLLSMLRSLRYTVFQKEAIAYVCSALGMEEAFEDIALVREASARSMSMKQLYRFKRDQKREMRRHNLM